MTDFSREWIASRAGLIATFSKPFRDMPQDKVGLSILATNDLPRALAALRAVLELANNPYPDARNVSGRDLVRAVEAALRGER